MTSNNKNIPVVDSIAVLGEHNIVKASMEKSKHDSAYNGLNHRINELEDAIGQACKNNITRAFAIRAEASEEEKLNQKDAASLL